MLFVWIKRDPPVFSILNHSLIAQHSQCPFFRPSATVSPVGLMESYMSLLSLSLVWLWDPTSWLADPPLGCPPKLLVMKRAALWSHVCVIVEDPPPLAG